MLLKDDFISFSPNNVELMTNYVDKTDDYWEKLKHQYAGMAMQGLLASKEQELLNTQELVEDAIIYATALVEKLKESKV